MSIFDRRMQIALMLKRLKKITRTELSNIFNVSDNTIGRDLDALTIYIKIERKLGRYGYIYIDEEKDKYIFSEEESELILRILKDLCDEQEKRVFIQILEKIGDWLEKHNIFTDEE